MCIRDRFVSDSVLPCIVFRQFLANCDIYEKSPHRYAVRTVFLLQAVFLVETVNTSTGVNKLLLAGVEGMALRADFNLDVLLCGTGCENVATGTADRSLFVLGMDTFLHEFHLSHQISVKRQTALPLVQTPRYSTTGCARMQG